MQSQNICSAIIMISFISASLIGCGSEDHFDLSDPNSKSEVIDQASVPHLDNFNGAHRSGEGLLEGTSPSYSAIYAAPNGVWIGSKMIIRKGIHLSISSWVTALDKEKAPTITMEMYRWQGPEEGWGTQVWTANSDDLGACTNKDLYAEDYNLASTDPEDVLIICNEPWEVPQDGRYLLMVTTSDADDLRVDLGSEEYYTKAATCQDDPGICKKLDEDASCGYWCSETDDSGVCILPEAPDLVCGYPFTPEGWVSADVE